MKKISAKQVKPISQTTLVLGKWNFWEFQILPKEIRKGGNTPHVENEFVKLCLTESAMLEVAEKEEPEMWLDLED